MGGQDGTHSSVKSLVHPYGRYPLPLNFNIVVKKDKVNPFSGDAVPERCRKSWRKHLAPSPAGHEGLVPPEILVQYMVVCLDPLLAHGAERLDEGKFFPQYINFSEKDRGSIGDFFCGKHLTARTLRIFLTHHRSFEYIVCIFMNQSFFFVCHVFIIIPIGDSRKHCVCEGPRAKG